MIGHGVRGGIRRGVAPTPSPMLPFDMPANDLLKSKPQKYFAHYFTPYPLSTNNTADSQYTGLLSTSYNVAYGGLLRERPIPRDPLSGDYQTQDFQTEVTRASSSGLDGFTVDLLSLPETTNHYNWDRFVALLRACPGADPLFRIMLMPDCNSLSGPNNMAARGGLAGPLADGLQAIIDEPALFRLDDGRLVISAFAAENVGDGVRDGGRTGAVWWKYFLDMLKAEPYNIDAVVNANFLNYGTSVSSFQTQLGYYNSGGYIHSYGNWGNRNPAANASLATNINDAHARNSGNCGWMQPVSIQDQRPNQHIYDEAWNSLNLRTTWAATIDNDVEWVQVPTWNDYSEGASLSPSTHIGWGPIDVSAYYNIRWKLGSYPTIVRDCIYLIHRRQLTTYNPGTWGTDPGQYVPMSLRSGSTAAKNEVEVFAFLTAAAQLTVHVGGNTYGPTDLGQGISNTNVALAAADANAITAEVTRSGDTVASVTSPFAVNQNTDQQDLGYCWLSSARGGLGI